MFHRNVGICKSTRRWSLQDQYGPLHRRENLQCHNVVDQQAATLSAIMYEYVNEYSPQLIDLYKGLSVYFFYGFLIVIINLLIIFYYSIFLV